MIPSPPKMVSLISRVSQPPRLYFYFSVYSILKHPLEKRSIGENTILELWWWRNAGCCWGVVSLRQKESPTIPVRKKNTYLADFLPEAGSLGLRQWSHIRIPIITI